MILKVRIFVLVLFFSVVTISQTLNITVSENNFGIDASNLIIVSRMENIENFIDIQNNYTEVTISFNGSVFTFNTVPNSLSYSSSYSVFNTVGEFTLFFTSLPLIHIDSTIEIVDEPKTPANFVYVGEEVIESIIGIELHGASSQTFPKKTYNIEFWDDEEGENSHNERLANLRNDDDWILDGLWNEPMRLRSYTANKYWLEIHTPSYSDDEPNAKPGVDVAYAEMFLNGSYNGIYLISEKVDRKLLKLKKYNDVIRGELYKSTSYQGAPGFSALIDFDNQLRSWNNYDYKYPKENQETNWQNIYDYVDFVMHSTDEEFKNNIWNYFDKENAIHFFIFTNFLRARDNTTKNTYLSKYKQSTPYFMVPWDLDMIWGNSWNGSVDEEMGRIMSSRLFDRLIESSDRTLFLNDLIEAWDDLREGLISLESVESHVDIPYNYLVNNNIYNREYMVYPSHDFNTRDFISYRLENRLQFMDTYFNVLRFPASVSDPIKECYIYPNPSANSIGISLDEDVVFKLYDINNRLVLKGETKDKSIDVSVLNAGVYLLKIKNTIIKIVKL